MSDAEEALMTSGFNYSLNPRKDSYRNPKMEFIKILRFEKPHHPIEQV